MTPVVPFKETILRALPVSDPESRHRWAHCIEELHLGQFSCKGNFHTPELIFRLTFNIKLENFFPPREEKERKNERKREIKKREIEKNRASRLNKNRVYECNRATHLKITNMNGKKRIFL